MKFSQMKKMIKLEDWHIWENQGERHMYLQLRAEGSFPREFLCKVKIAMKVRIFHEEKLKNSILIKDNLLKMGWTGNVQCHFCSQNENIDLLFFGYELAKLV
jgi:hypothetical protein